MKKIFSLLLICLLLMPTIMFTTSASASFYNSNDGLAIKTSVENLNKQPAKSTTNSETIVEHTRKKIDGGFDDFLEKIRKPSMMIGVTLIAISGVLACIGFVFKPLLKWAGGLFGGVLLGLFLINYGEYLVGMMYAFWDWIVANF